MSPILIDSFVGGLNLRDSPNELASNESPAANDWTLDERGALKRRKGHTNVVALPGTSGTVADIFYSEALNLWLCVRESTTKKLFSRPGDLSGSWTDRGQISNSVTARACFADWPGSTRYCLIGTDSADVTNGGVYTFDGTTLTKRDANPVVAIAVWQNKAWTCQHIRIDDGGNIVNATRLARSAAGDPTTWGDFTDIRDKDAAALLALAVCSGALIAYKKRSAYRITDATTGAYTTIDSAHGCVNPRALAQVRGRLYSWGTDGLYESDGVGPLVNIGDKLRPLFSSSSTFPATIVAGVHQDRLIFAGEINGTKSLVEFDPRTGWGIRHFHATPAQDTLPSLARQEATLYAAVSDGDDLFSLFTATAGADDGTAYTSNWLTPWFLPNSGALARLQRLIVQGLIQQSTSAELALTVFKGWDTGSGDFFDLTASLLGSGSLQQRAAALQALGHSDAFAFSLVAQTATGDIQVRALQLFETLLRWPDTGYPERQKRSSGGYSDRGSRQPGPSPVPIGTDRGPR